MIQGAIAGQSGAAVQDSALIAVRAQVDILLQMQDMQTSIVLWSLATVAGLTISLLAFGWYTNFRIAGRERDALREELEGMVRTQMSEHAGRIHAQVEEVKKGLPDTVSQVVNNRVFDLRHDLLNVQFDLQLREVERAQAENEDFFLDAVRLLDVAIRGDWSWRIDEALELVEASLRGKSRSPDPGIAAKLEGHFSKLAPGYQVTVRRIRSLLESV